MGVRVPPGALPSLPEERAQFHPPVAGARPRRGEREGAFLVGNVDDPEAAVVVAVVREGTGRGRSRAAAVVDDGRRVGRADAGGEHPVTVVAEPVVEGVDGRHLVAARGSARVVDDEDDPTHGRESRLGVGRMRT